MKPRVSLRKALQDPNLLGKALQGDSWAAWRALLYAIRGEPLLQDELDHFKRLTGRAESPKGPVHEAWAVVGRRGGKSRAAAVLIVYIACLCQAKLAPGEIGQVLCLSMSRDQAALILSYAYAALEQSPLLRKLIRRRTAEVIELTNGVHIAVHSASFRRVRGVTSLACVADEIAYWYDEA